MNDFSNFVSEFRLTPAKADEYQTFAVNRVIGAPAPIDWFLVKGILGESGEVADKVKKVHRGDYSKDAVREPLIRELGDTLWYVANLAYEFRLSLYEIACDPSPVQRTQFDLSNTVLNLGASAGRTAAVVQMIRERYQFNTSPLSSDLKAQHRSIVRENLRDVYRALQQIGIHVRANMGEVCDANVAKLVDRDARGTNRGDGDDR